MCIVTVEQHGCTCMCLSVYTSIFSSQRKKKSTDSASSTNEPKSQGTSLPPSKKQRLPVVKVRDAPDRTTMTMRELIYYNPTANPMRYAYVCTCIQYERVQNIGLYVHCYQTCYIHCTCTCNYMYMHVHIIEFKDD